MPTGRVVRAIGGFFYIEPFDAQGKTIEASIRGKLKLSPEGILVGDLVEYSNEEGKTVINKVLPRETLLKRPYISNVNLLILVFAHKDPEPNPDLIARFLILAAINQIPHLLVFNKSDLVGRGKADKLANYYRKLGYQVICTSVLKNQGKRNLKRELLGKVAVFSGPSGVGKSALLNMLAPGFRLQTGSVSEKIGRGKHTTREVQLLKLNENSYVADTPGFTQIELDLMEPENLADYFFDFADFLGNCKFSSCLHQNEPGCSLRQAVSDGAVSEDRYQTYLKLLQEIKSNWENRYR